MNGSKNEPNLTDGIAIDKGLKENINSNPAIVKGQLLQQQLSKLIAEANINGNGFHHAEQSPLVTQLKQAISNLDNKPTQQRQQQPIADNQRSAAPQQAQPIQHKSSQATMRQQQAPPQQSLGVATPQRQQSPQTPVANSKQAPPVVALKQPQTPSQQQQQSQQSIGKEAPISTSSPKKSQVEGEIPTKPEKIVKKRLRKLEPKPKPYDKYAWLAGHIITIIGTIIYASYYFTFRSHKSFYAHLIYRVSFAGVLVAYFVSLLNQFGTLPPSYFTLLTTDNFQYLLLAGVWFFNRSSFFKILPYFLIALLHLSSFFHIKPILKLEPTFKQIIIYNELFLFVLLLFDTFLLRGTSGYALVIFTLFYSLKIVFNDETKGLVYSVIIKFDGVMAKQKNPKVQALWHDIKSFLLKKKAAANSYSFKVKKQ